jgi:hypothetical protein
LSADERDSRNPRFARDFRTEEVAVRIATQNATGTATRTATENERGI